jgi:precorrin-3B C17-methyltransferase
MKKRGRLFVVGLGPGDRGAMTSQALDALRLAEVVVGFRDYFSGITDLVEGKECVALGLTQEVERARMAVERFRQGRVVCVVSSGDPGVYGMASLVLECLGEEGQEDFLVVPGVSAVNAAAALLGAPLGHDFAVVSLSDLLTPWEAIERRLRAAAEADFVVALLNPKSRRRDWQYRRAQEVLKAYRDPETPVGVVRNACRSGQAVVCTTVARMAEAAVDMFTTVIVGNSRTHRLGGALVTPRGYALRESGMPASGGRQPPVPVQQGADAPRSPGSEILAESFRIIDEEVGPHSFGPLEWAVVRRMIHASGDLELGRLVHFSPGAVAAGVRAFQEGVPIVTDVRTVAAGIQGALREELGVAVYCFLDCPEASGAAERGQTRCAAAVEQAIANYPEAIYAIGNAPTALAALCAAVRRGTARPRLAIAMPVGFVGVLESKEEALALPVPVVAVRGRRGGSAVAAAAVNALLLLAREERGP